MPDSSNLSSSSSFSDTQSIADVLFSENLLTKEQYNDVKVKSASEGVSEESVIVELGSVPEEKISAHKKSCLQRMR